MSGKRVTKPPRKYDENEDLEANSVRRTVPYVKVKFVDDGQTETYDSALLCGEIINPKNDEAIKFVDLYLGQEVAALWKNTNHYLATIIELFKGDQDSTCQRLATQQSDNDGKVNGKLQEHSNKKAKKSKEKKVQKSSKDSDDGTEGSINSELKKKKKEIQAENKKKKEAVIASNQQIAAALFAKYKNDPNNNSNVLSGRNGQKEPYHTGMLVPTSSVEILDISDNTYKSGFISSSLKVINGDDFLDNMTTSINNTAVPASEESCHTHVLQQLDPINNSNVLIGRNGQKESYHTGMLVPTSSVEILDISDNTYKSGFISSSLKVINGDDFLGSSTPRSPTPPPPFQSCNVSDASQNCFDCEIKDKIIKDLKAEINQLKQSASTSNLEHHATRKRKYQPKTRPEVEIADYIEIGPNDVIPDGFHLFAPGSSIAVNSLWLHHTLSLISNQRCRKEKKAVKKGKGVRENREVEILKKLMDGFFYPWDLAVEGGTTKFQTNPVYKGLQLYATHHLKMDIPYFKKCWNAKMVSARQTVKRQSSLATKAAAE